MKLLFVSNLFPDSCETYRGLDNACLLHQLSDDCDVRVISPRPSLSLRKQPAKECRPIDGVLMPIYLRSWYVPKAGSLFNHHLMAHAIRRPLLELKKTFPFDVILCSWIFPDACAVSLLQQQLRVPFIAIAQGSDVHAYLRMPARRKVIVKSLQNASAVVTRSAKLAQLLRGAGVTTDKLNPIYNGVDLDLFKPGDKQAARTNLGLPTGPVVLFVGNFLPVKNPLLLIEAHASLCREQPAHLIMIGSGPMEGQVRQLADASGFGNYVVLAGRKSAEEISDYMRAADVLCMSSENEGVPNVILEAFASGLRVVSTDVGGISEVLNHDFLGRLVERGNVPALKTALADTLKSEPNVDRIRTHAMNFSWARAAKEYMELLSQASPSER